MKNYSQEIIFKELILESLNKSYENANVFSQDTLNKMTNEIYKSSEFNDYIKLFDKIKIKIDNIFDNNLYINASLIPESKIARISSYPEKIQDKLPESFYYKNDIGFSITEELKNNCFTKDSKRRHNCYIKISLHLENYDIENKFEVAIPNSNKKNFDLILQRKTIMYIKDKINTTNIQLLIETNNLLSTIDFIPLSNSIKNMPLNDFLQKKEVIEFIELLALNKDIDFRETVSQIKNANEIKKVKFEK